MQCKVFDGRGLKALIWIYTLRYLLLGIAGDNQSDNAATAAALTVSTPPVANESVCPDCTVSEKIQSEIMPRCPEFQSVILKGLYPKGNSKAGIYTVEDKVKSPEECARHCCLNSTDCNIAFMVNTTCYLLACKDAESCATTKVAAENLQRYNISMVVVRVPKTDQLKYGMRPSNYQKTEMGYASAWRVSCLAQREMDPCEVATNPETETNITTITPPSSTTPKTVKTLAVSVVSKNVTLQINEVSLFAYAVPEAPAENFERAIEQPYSYKWSLVSHPPEDSAMMEGQATQQLHLMGLKQGTYIFEVSVKSPEANGSANATIDVFAEKRLNRAPIAVISPAEQTTHLPTKSAVLDASLSTDDDKIISYLWELQKGPVEYVFNPTKASNSTTLQVENLTPGNYTFKLTVVDSEHTKNFTTASISVIKETDYPPTANAGKDIVIYLPQKKVTLNGNASTDDKKIIEWEWKATGDLNRAVDMQDTHTPFLKLSGLQVGLYQFKLKVTDEAGQSATSTVHVIVKLPTGNPPKANAGTEQTIIIPQNWVVLDGSGSTSDSSKIVKYSWTQLKGPSNTTITSLSENAKANVTGLTKGEYEFQLEVEDEAKLTNTISVKISVMQKINDPPKAHAGGDLSVTLPCTLVKLNGSASTDDVKIAEWQWERQPDSLAAGVILSHSDSSPVLQLTDLVAGKYVFKLTVKDKQGLSDKDSVTLTVTDDVRKKDLLEIIVDVHIYSLSTSDRDKVIQQMTLLLHDTKLILSSMPSQMHTENAVLILYGQDEKGNIIDGPQLARQLRQKIHQDDGLLQFPIMSVDTVLCLDKCSGHGVCQDTPSGRECLCSAFWMENVLKRKYGDGERNCDWSKIYVGVVACLLLMMVIALFWSLVFIFQKNFRTLKENINGKLGSPSGRENNGKRHHAHKKQYTLLDDDDEEIELEAKDEEDDGESDDSDSDILFETKRPNKPKNGFKKSSGNGVGPHRNGILKPPRRIKT